MNIIDARKLAIAGMTVIAPNGVEFIARDFSDDYEGDWTNEMVFGEWSLKKEPVVFEAEVSIANETLYGSGVGMIADRELRSLIGKRVKVTVEVLP